MYIYLDESYNLKDRDKKQFISINGFMVLDVVAVRKKWLNARKIDATKRRIHAHEKFFELLRKKAFKILGNHQVFFLSVFQEISSIPSVVNCGYWKKNSLDFEKVYLEMSRQLLFSLNLDEYKKVIITFDNRKNKAGIIGKNLFREMIAGELNKLYPTVNIPKPRLIPSASDILLELADFVSNEFYRYYQDENNTELDKLQIKIIQIKNPLK